MFGYILLITFITVAFFFLIKRNNKYKNIPPGLPALPIIGSLYYMNKNHKKKGFGGFMWELAMNKQYGDLVSVWMGPNLIVVVNDYKLARELFSKDDFSGRAISWWHKNVRGFQGRNLGIINTSGDFWQEQRRFALKQLRDLGFGRRSLDFVIHEEASEVIRSMLEVSKESGGHLLVDSTFNTAVINVLWQIVANKRFDPKDPNTKKLMEILNNQFREGFAILNLFPFLRSLIPDFLTPQRDKDLLYLKEVFRKLIKEHEIEFDPSSPRDFVDVYLCEIRSGKSKNFDIEQLVVICLDFFQAGAETTSTTLLWSVLYMAINQEVQRKCQQEIEQVLGSNLPTLSDQQRLSYVSATIMEIQRMSCTAPGSLPHRLMAEQADVQGYKIPKGTIFMSNLVRIMRDPEVFPEPEKFNPDRFLAHEADGSVKLVKLDSFAPFGIGKRICMGESLARSELFIFFVMLIQRMSFGPPDGSDGQFPKLDTTNFTSGITLIPRPFHIKLENRNIFFNSSLLC